MNEAAAVTRRLIDGLLEGGFGSYPGPADSYPMKLTTNGQVDSRNNGTAPTESAVGSSRVSLPIREAPAYRRHLPRLPIFRCLLPEII
jgi:hypothetical protein